MRINRYEFLILFYAGLIKGVVAYALICEDEAGGEDYYVFINYATLYLVLGTTVLVGGTLKYVAEWSFE
jgi:sodium/hydrogen exchanger-like protein 6/7/sodium/hydrogen exchanger 8